MMSHFHQRVELNFRWPCKYVLIVLHAPGAHGIETPSYRRPDGHLSAQTNNSINPIASVPHTRQHPTRFASERRVDWGSPSLNIYWEFQPDSYLFVIPTVDEISLLDSTWCLPCPASGQHAHVPIVLVLPWSFIILPPLLRHSMERAPSSIGPARYVLFSNPGLEHHVPL
jgi:hypothetical protein